MSKEPLDRKKAYVENLASPTGIDLSMLDWSSSLELINLQIGADVAFRTLLDTFLNLNLNFEFKEFDFHGIDFPQQFEPEFTKIPKARYGMTRYGYSYYDPPEATSKDLERMVWKFKKWAIDKHELAYKSSGQSLKTLIESIKQRLIEKGVKKEYLDAIEEALSLAEGKFFSTAYVGFTIVGLHKIGGKRGDATVLKFRDAKDWKTEWDINAYNLYECYVGYSRVGYCRVTSRRMQMKKSIGDHIRQEISEFRKRVGEAVAKGKFLLPYYGYAYPAPTGYEYEVKTLQPRVFMLQRMDQYHYEGGSHQIKIQTVINEVKKRLDKYGVVTQMRMAYIAFAQELYYLSYQPHKLWKRYRNVLSENDLIEKYKSMGCDETILNVVKGVVKP